MTQETFTNGYLFSLQHPPETSPLKELMKIDVPAKVGIRVARLIRLLTKEIEPIAEVHNKLIIKYGERGEKDLPFINGKSPHWDEFALERDALMGATVELDFEKVVLPDDVRIPVGVLVALEPFLAVADIAGASPNGEATNIGKLIDLVKS